MRCKILSFFLLLASWSWAQELSNVDFKVNGKQVVVTYNLSGCESADIGLYLSKDGGRTFETSPLKAVSGDVGSAVAAGNNQMTWRVLGDYPAGIVGNLAFRVKVRGNVKVKPLETITVNGVSFDMVRVEGGTFTMGATTEQGEDADADEKPAHRETLSTYYIGRYEVTQRLWKAVMGNNPSEHKGDDFPVENVSWEDCQKFIAKLNQLTGKRFALPTEAQWEYAARGGNKSRGYKYSGSSNIGTVAWYYDNSGNQTHRVGTKQANELGLYDMSGNVWEWCQDWYGENYYSSSSKTNPQGPSNGSGRVLRGGCSWINARNCRVSNRGNGTPVYRFDIYGFRLVVLF